MKDAEAAIRRSQLLYTYGPGAFLDLPRDAALVGGLEQWPWPTMLERIEEPRLAALVQQALGLQYAPPLHVPPTAPDFRHGPAARKKRSVRVFRFPQWFLVQDDPEADGRRSRRLVHARRLDDDGRFDRRRVVATRFVRACPRGHVDDIDWRFFVHQGAANPCRLQLRIVERGTTGDLSDLTVACACGAQRNLGEAVHPGVLGRCPGSRPWLGPGERERCDEEARLLVRTATNAYFPQVLRVLSIRASAAPLEEAVEACWATLQAVRGLEDLVTFRGIPHIGQALAAFGDEEVFAAIERRKGGGAERSPKLDELEAFLAAPEGFGEDVPIDPDFHARRLPERVWRRDGAPGELLREVEAVVQLHRLREVSALVGFTRLDPVLPDVDGRYASDAEPAPLSVSSDWFPAVENRGEGFFVQLRSEAVLRWLERPAVQRRIEALRAGHARWCRDGRAGSGFPGGAYVLLHTLGHMLLQAVALRAGYPANAIRERIYVDTEGRRYGLLLYTSSSDAEGTLGGLVVQARRLGEHLRHALRAAALCASDPVCAEHRPESNLERRYLHGASCHNCTLVGEPSCEMRNEFLDRALLVPVMGQRDAAFFPMPALTP